MISCRPGAVNLVIGIKERRHPRILSGTFLLGGRGRTVSLKGFPGRTGTGGGLKCR